MAKSLKETLEARLRENTTRHNAASHVAVVDLGRRHVKLAVDLIDPNPYQPRKRASFTEESISGLAASISAVGLKEPIVVRQVGPRYELLAGERRLRAHRQLGLSSIEALIEDASDQEMAVGALVENIARANLTDFEIADALRKLEEHFPTRTQLAESLGIDRKDMYRYLAYFALPSYVLRRLEERPDLIGRAAVEQLKATIVAHAEHPQLESGVLKALAAVEEGNLPQNKMVSFIESELRPKESGRGSGHSPVVEFSRAGQLVGRFERRSRNVVVTLSKGTLTPTQEEELIAFLQVLTADANGVAPSAGTDVGAVPSP